MAVKPQTDRVTPAEETGLRKEILQQFLSDVAKVTENETDEKININIMTHNRFRAESLMTVFLGDNHSYRTTSELPELLLMLSD